MKPCIGSQFLPISSFIALGCYYMCLVFCLVIKVLGSCDFLWHISYYISRYQCIICFSQSSASSSLPSYSSGKVNEAFLKAFNTLACVITTTSEYEQMLYLSKLAGMGRCVSIGDSFITLDYVDPPSLVCVTLPFQSMTAFLAVATPPQWVIFLSRFTIGLVKEIGNDGTVRV